MKLFKLNPAHLNFMNLHHNLHTFFFYSIYLNMNTSDSTKEPRKAYAIRKISQPPATFSARLPSKKPLDSKQGKIISQHNEEETEFVRECFSGMFWDDAEDKQ